MTPWDSWRETVSKVTNDQASRLVKRKILSERIIYWTVIRNVTGVRFSHSWASQLSGGMHHNFIPCVLTPTHPYFLTVIHLIPPSFFIIFKAIIFSTSFCLNTYSTFSHSVELCDIISHSPHFSVLIYFRISKGLPFVYCKTLSPLLVHHP
jgi:hypothetical protein